MNCRYIHVEQASIVDEEVEPENERSEVVRKRRK